MSNIYNENRHPGRRKGDREGHHVHIARQVNITIESGGICAGGNLTICMETRAGNNGGEDDNHMFIPNGQATSE